MNLVRESILVPLDGTSDSEIILDYLPGLLSSPKTEVLILHAFPFLNTLINLPLELGPGTTQATSDGADSVAYVTAVVERLKGQGIKARGLAQLGSSAEVILESANANHVSLIAMCTHGRSGLSHLLFATVTEQVLKRSVIPFFVVHTPMTGSEKESLMPLRVGGWLKTVLMPVSRNLVSLDILPFALRWARRCGSLMKIIHVAESHEDSFAAASALKRAAALCKAEGVRSEERNLVGNPVDEILKVARFERADLIAMTTHAALRGVEGPLGSVTLSVMRASPVPLLLVRGLPKSAEKKAPHYQSNKSSKSR